MQGHRILLKSRLILEHEGTILLMKQTNLNGGKYTLPGGTVEANEFAAYTLQRECREETGIIINPNAVELVHTLHKKKGERSRIVLYFKVNDWLGSPESLEPEKFQEVDWLPLTNLPDRLSPTVRHVLSYYTQGIRYSEFSKH